MQRFRGTLCCWGNFSCYHGPFYVRSAFIGHCIVAKSFANMPHRTATDIAYRSFSQSVFRQQERTHAAMSVQCAATDAAYKRAIAALNNLQTNAATLNAVVRSHDEEGLHKQLEAMVGYLERSGLELQTLEKLSFIHVAGTKGKGSTCALAESILRAHGVRTGFFSSPHLVSVNERISINGTPISKAAFARIFWRVYDRLQATAADELDMPSYFKFLTLMSFHVFVEEKVDVIVLEVGIGGELDCTNIIRNTGTVGITSLGLEHTMVLGNTLTQIARQKAGIIKRGCNVYTHVSQPECLKIIKQVANERQATLHVVPTIESYFSNPNDTLRDLNDVVLLNGSLAMQLALDWLRVNRKEDTFHTAAISDKVLTGLRQCNWPGRCQLVEFLDLHVYLDGAHTVESMRVCSNWFKRATAKSAHRKILIFNRTSDVDSRPLLDILSSEFEFDMACFVPNIPTARPTANSDDFVSVENDDAVQLERARLHAQRWETACGSAGKPANAHVFSSVFDALKSIDEHYTKSEPGHKLDVLVTGSLHLVGAAIAAIDDYGTYRRSLQST